MTPLRHGLPALALLALTATACEDPAAGRTAVRRASPTAAATHRATTAPPKPPARRATAKPTPATARVVRPSTQPPRPAPSPAPRRTTAAPKPRVVDTCGAPRNPWGYNFCGRGSVISDPPASFCTYFDCIGSFWENTNGYVMRCDDGMFSHSGGRRGSCSWHDGNDQPLYG